MRPTRRAVPTPFSTGFKGIAEAGVPVLFLVGITIVGIRSADPAGGGSPISDLSEVAMTQTLDDSSDPGVTGNGGSGGFSNGEVGSPVGGRADSSSTFRTAAPTGDEQRPTGTGTDAGSTGAADSDPGLTDDDRGLIGQTDQRGRTAEATAEEQQRLLDEYWQAVVREAESGVLDLSLFDTPILLVPDPEVGLRPVFTDPDNELAAPPTTPVVPVVLPSPEPDPVPQPDTTQPDDGQTPDMVGTDADDTDADDTDASDIGGTNTDNLDTDTDAGAEDDEDIEDGEDGLQPTPDLPETDPGTDPDQQDTHPQDGDGPPADDPSDPADPDLVCPTPEPTGENTDVSTERPTSPVDEVDDPGAEQSDVVQPIAIPDPNGPEVSAATESETLDSTDETVTDRAAPDHDHNAGEDCLPDPDDDEVDSVITDPTAPEPDLDQPAAEKPATSEPDLDQPAKEKPATPQPALGEPATKAPPIDESPVGVTPHDELRQQESGDGEPIAVQDPVVEDPMVERAEDNTG